VEKRRSGGMAQIKSQFGTGWVVCGNAEKLLLNEEPADWEEEASVMLAQETKHFQVPEFLSAGSVSPKKMHFLQELQRMSVQDECHILQGGS